MANPLFIAHRLADAVEMAAAEAEERTGAPAPEPLEWPLGDNRAAAPLEWFLEPRGPHFSFATKLRGDIVHGEAIAAKGVGG